MEPISFLIATTVSCYNVGYHYDPATKVEKFFNNTTGAVLGTYVDAVRPAPDPQQAARDRGLCVDFPSV